MWPVFLLNTLESIINWKMEEKRGQESIQMSLITTASCFLKHCRSFLTIGRVFLVFFWSAARLLAFPLMSTICSHSNSDILFLGTRQHWWCPSVVCGWWNWSQVFEGFSQYLPVLFSRLRLIILYIRRRRSSHSRTVRAFAHLILHNHVNDLRNARFWTLVFK